MAFDLDDEELEATRKLNGLDDDLYKNNKLTEKEIQEKINNPEPDKYIYQRYEGIIRKFIDNGEHYIECKTGISSNKNKTIMLGKVSENIIDLIEVGDYVNGEPVEKVEKNEFDYIEITTTTEYITEDYYIKSIVTKEQFSKIEYRI